LAGGGDEAAFGGGVERAVSRGGFCGGCARARCRSFPVPRNVYRPVVPRRRATEGLQGRRGAAGLRKENVTSFSFPPKKSHSILLLRRKTRAPLLAYRKPFAKLERSTL